MGRTWALSGFVVAVAVLSSVVWSISARISLEALDRRGRADLRLATDRLVGELHAQRQLAATLSRDPRLTAGSVDPDALGAILRRAADASGLLDISLIDRGGGAIASSSVELDRDLPVDAAAAGAWHGTLGKHHEVSGHFDRRVFYYGLPVFGPTGSVDRVLIAAIDLERIEAEIAGSSPVILVAGPSGQVIFTNRSELAGQTESRSRNFTFLGHDIRRFDAGPHLPALALHLHQDIPVIDMTGEAIVDLSDAFRATLLQAAAVAAMLLSFGLALLLLAERRRVLASANSELEGRVALRTAELSEANSRLETAIKNRIELGSQLLRLEDKLNQAERKSIVARLNANITHELRNPLMAIQAHIANAKTLMDRREPAAAMGVLAKVEESLRRVSQTIKDFNDLAKEEEAAAGKVDLWRTIGWARDDALERIGGDGVRLTLENADDAIWVRGNNTRIYAVVTNLINNAIDAMGESGDRRVTISVEDGDMVTIKVKDTGPGIKSPDLIFEPGFTTKPPGQTSGSGQGLAIARRLVEIYGGQISARNHPDGGAEFTVKLHRWIEEAA